MNQPTTRHAWSIDAVGFLTAVALSLSVTLSQLPRLDLRFGDETIYLHAGLDPAHALPLAKSSALYASFYRVLSWFEPSPEALYFLSWCVLTAALPPVLYVLARKGRAPAWAALLASFAWAASSATLVWPSVSKFATLVLAIGLLIALSVRDRTTSFGVLAATVLLAGYARPELVAIGWASTGAFLVYALVTARKYPKRLAHATGALALLVAVVVGYGTPYTDNRSFEAFEQHYALNAADAAERADASEAPPETWNDPGPSVGRAFGAATTVTGALRANPRAFFWHVGQNARLVPGAVVDVIAPLGTLRRPVRWAATAALGALALLGALSAASVMRRIRRRGRRALPWLAFGAVIAGSAAAAAIVIYPRAHYLVPVCFFGLAGLASGAQHLVRAGRRIDLRLAPAVALVMLFTAVPSVHPRAHLAGVDQSHPARATVAALDRLDLPDGVAILESDIGRVTFLGRRYDSVGPWEKPEGAGLFEFLEERQVDVVVIDDRLRADPRFVDELADHAALEQRADEEGFEMMRVPGTAVTILFRDTES